MGTVPSVGGLFGQPLPLHTAGVLTPTATAVVPPQPLPAYGGASASPALVVTITAVAALAGAALGAVASAVLGRARAPARVPVAPVAAGTAALWAVAGWRWLAGALPSWWLPVPLAVAALGVPLAVADLRHRRLPDVLTLPAYPVLAAALCASAVAGPGTGLLLRAAGAAIVFGGLHLLVHALSRGSLGAGDVKLAGALGAVLGAVSWSALVVAAALAAVTTAVLAVARRQRDGVPHGPGLLLATWLVAVFAGADVGT